jgi:hypothetical protein
MITLYQGSGASGYSLLDSPISDEELLKLKSAVTRLLLARKQQNAAASLQLYQFELSNGTNFFGDAFLVLHAKLPVEEYVKLSECMSDPTYYLSFKYIAAAFQELSHYIRFISIDVDTNDRGTVVETLTPKITSATVERALKDAENLLHSNGAISAVDRIHTAIHGYLKAVCEDQNIEYAYDAGLTQLFGLLRDNHPCLKLNGPNDPDIVRILRSSAAILESINNVRNRASVAHPNTDLLDEPEAILAINSVRTLLHYLDAKIRKSCS